MGNMPPRLRQLIIALAAMIAIFWIVGTIVSSKDDGSKKVEPTIVYSNLLDMIENGKIRKIEWDPNSFVVYATLKKTKTKSKSKTGGTGKTGASGTTKTPGKTQPSKGRDKRSKPYVVVVPGNQQGLAQLLEIARSKRVEIAAKRLEQSSGSSTLESVIRILMFVAIIGLLIYYMRSMGTMKKMQIAPALSTTTFNDVAGCDEAIEELEDVRKFLANPASYEKLGARVPKGVLLYGPPGTGKTLLAKAVANEAGIPFFQTSGSEFVQMYVGVGASRVRDLFSKAKESAPSIIFIDEIDAVGGKRSGGAGEGGKREADQTLVQLLNEMDGFNVSKDPVIIMAATNRIDTLDPALMRPGRFDRHIAIDPPDKEGRHQILQIHSRKKKLSEDVNLERMALHSSGMSGADLENWLNEAALIAARSLQHEITHSDVDEALMRVMAGAKKQNRVMSDEEREKVSYHEAGHAIIGEVLNTSNKVHKISIIPRGRSGGQTISVSERDQFLHTPEDLKHQITMLMGGRAAESHKFHEVSSGAHDDLKRSSEVAMNMVTKLGMGEAIGLLVESDQVKMSSALRDKIDAEARKILEEQYVEAERILDEQWDSVERVARTLLDEETIDRERFLGVIDLKSVESKK